MFSKLSILSLFGSVYVFLHVCYCIEQFEKTGSIGQTTIKKTCKQHVETPLSLGLESREFLELSI